MLPFSLAMIATDGRLRSAIVVEGRTYPLAELDAELGALDSKALLLDWDAMLPRLKALASTVSKRGGLETPHVLAPVLYPDSLLAVGANYAGHLKEMGLPVEKWAVMPFF